MTDLAPIALFVYARPEHTLKTLEALQSNTLASHSHLTIYADGPKPNATDKDLHAIQEVRRVIRLNQWCKVVNIIESDENSGLANSVIHGISIILEESNKVIVLEDDIITSRHFLKYMNQALSIYQDQDKVGGISGFCYPNSGGLDQTYFLPICASWGWGTWKRAWDNFQVDSEYLLSKISDDDTSARFNFGHYPFSSMLQAQAQGKVDSWAIRFYASIFLKGQFFLFPEQSLVNNIGFDDSGVHSTSNDQYYNSHAVAQDFGDISKIPVELKENCVMSVRKHFEIIHKPPTFLSRVFHRVKKLFYAK